MTRQQRSKIGFHFRCSLFRCFVVVSFVEVDAISIVTYFASTAERLR